MPQIMHYASFIDAIQASDLTVLSEVFVPVGQLNYVTGIPCFEYNQSGHFLS